MQSFEHRENDVKNLKTQLDILTRSEQTNQALLAKQEEEMAAVTKERNKYQDRLKEFESELAKTKNSLREATQESREQEAATGTNRSVPPATVLGLCLAVTLLIAVTLWLGRPRSPLLGFVEEPPRDYPPESSFTQEGSKKSAAETNTERG